MLMVITTSNLLTSLCNPPESKLSNICNATCKCTLQIQTKIEPVEGRCEVPAGSTNRGNGPGWESPVKERINLRSGTPWRPCLLQLTSPSHPPVLILSSSSHNQWVGEAWQVVKWLHRKSVAKYPRYMYYPLLNKQSLKISDKNNNWKLTTQSHP